MIQYFMKQYLFLLWGITSLIFSSLFLACSDDEPGDKTPVFTIKEEYLQQDFDQKQSSLVIPVETNLAADAWVVSSNQLFFNIGLLLWISSFYIDVSKTELR